MKVFVSYSVESASANYVKLFCTRLDEALARRGDKHTQHVVYDDALRSGDLWQARLPELLRQSAVVVPLYSPLYFASVACGKELGHFLCRLPPIPGGGGVAASLPVVPVWWDPTPTAVSNAFPEPPTSGDPRIDTLQHRSRNSTKYGDLSFEDLARQGLRHHLANEQHPPFRPVLDEFFSDLAERVDDLRKLHGPSLLPDSFSWADSPDAWEQLRIPTKLPLAATPLPRHSN